MEVEMEKKAYLRLRSCVERTYPQEACGVLLGNKKKHIPDGIQWKKSVSEECWKNGVNLVREKKNLKEEGKEGIREEFQIEEVRELQNGTEEEKKGRHFCVNPLQIYKLERELKKSGLEILGFYHSHPDCEAVLSEEDERYMIPEMLYLVVSVSNGQCDSIQGYQRLLG